VNTNTM